MARRRGSRAPYEIMGAVTRGSEAAAPDAPAAEAYDAELPSESGETGWRGALRGASIPVILRVPRGFAVLAIAGVLGLIVLAYFVGYSRGVTAAQTRVENRQAKLRSDRIPRVGRFIEVPPPRLVAEEAGDVAGGAVSSADPRRIGLNYLILARSPREEALRLARFLEGRGVETAVVPSDTTELFHVVGLRGFTSEEYRAGREQDYMDKMRRLGREWKDHNGGKGPDLSSMYWDQY